ncbi:hypothetical protein GCM10022229_24310 [Luteimonas lutimaris]|uniref:Uncharacterized protein n=1 Tax=Luteimonas lutimaris TaxID=698645 RepID=A0ABP7MT70_9GAMM
MQATLTIGILIGGILAGAVSPVIPRGETYPEARAALVRAGWIPAPSGADSRAWDKFGELVCGEGYQAVCSAEFRRNEDFLCIIFDGTEDPPTVLSIGSGEC